MMRVLRVILVIQSVASHPAMAAPKISTNESLLRVSRKAITTPGRAACEMVSPSRLCLRNRANAPNAPLTMPSAIAPRAMVRTV